MQQLSEMRWSCSAHENESKQLLPLSHLFLSVQISPRWPPCPHSSAELNRGLLEMLLMRSKQSRYLFSNLENNTRDNLTEQ